MLVTIAFSVIGVLGDYFLKLASAREQPLRTSWFYLGFALYASTAFGWVFVMKHLKLATISVLYSVSLVLLLTAIGVVLFQESLNYFEVDRNRVGRDIARVIDALRLAHLSHWTHDTKLSLTLRTSGRSHSWFRSSWPGAADSRL